jgi:hypothetical protein
LTSMDTARGSGIQPMLSGILHSQSCLLLAVVSPPPLP